MPYYRFRHTVKPGVTGTAQVKYPHGSPVEDAICYIKHQNCRMELNILFLTIKTVVLEMVR
nr:sugar transferase [Vibrio sp. F13]